MSARAIMVLGTSSDAGKSLTVAALCRMLRRDGHAVAPFKAQNMALNSFATRDGHEIGRAQAMQAEAARVEPHVDMNPILLKPQSDVGSQVILEGRVLGAFEAADYYGLRPRLVEAVTNAYRRLASRFDVVVLEGAGSPVEMNLKENDVVNMRMAELADARCVLVADIDRGGVFAQLVGTYELLEPDERARFAGFLVNKFRGDARLFDSGVTYLEERLGWPCLGVIPYLREHGIDDEDGVSVERRMMRPRADDPDALSVCVVGLPYMSNFTDFTALERAPGVALFYTRAPEDARVADVVVLPGSKNTIPDLLWLRETGWDRAIAEHAARLRPVVGICGGFQMLGREVRDPHRVESAVERVAGLGLLDAETELSRAKVTRQATARLADPARFGAATDCAFAGYEIHLGATRLGEGTAPLLRLRRDGERESIDDGAVSADGLVVGTYLHGLFDTADALRDLLSYLRRASGKTAAPATPFDPAAERERRYDALAEHFRANMRADALDLLLGP